MASIQTEPDFTRDEVKHILNTAYIQVADTYSDDPDLRGALHFQLDNAVNELDSSDREPMQILHQQMRSEQRVLDAYNKHRLGKAAHHYYKNFPKPADAVEYDEADNIPEELEWFPLRAEVSKHGINVTAPPIYQVDGAQEHTGEFIAKSAAGSANKSKTTAKKALTTATPSQTPKKKGRAAPNYDKVADAPSSRLGFPDGNLTMVEVLAFLPQSLKSWDVMDRFLWNGAYSVTIAGIINHFRTMPNGPIENNSVYRMMKTPMDKRALEDVTYKNWTVSVHQTLPKPAGFDATSISVAGFRAPDGRDRRRTVPVVAVQAPTILFRDLAKGVKVMPSGHDSLDLTRCVQYSVDHPDEDWYYPQDYGMLVEQLGAVPVQKGHQDRSIVRRYTSARKLKGAKTTVKRLRDSHGRLLKLDKKDIIDDDEDMMDTLSDDDSEDEIDFDALDNKGRKRKRQDLEDSDDENDISLTLKRKKSYPKSPARRTISTRRRRRGPSRLRFELKASDIDSESDSDVYQGPKKMKKSVTTPRSSGRTKRIPGIYDVEAALEPTAEEEEMLVQPLKWLSQEDMNMLRGNTADQGVQEADDSDGSVENEDGFKLVDENDLMDAEDNPWSED